MSGKLYLAIFITLKLGVSVLDMKKILFLFCAFFALNISAQESSDFDARLLFRYNQSQLDAMASVNPAQINYLNFYLNNACYFQDVEMIPIEKLQDYPDIFEYIALPPNYKLEVPVSKENFNILMYDVPFFENRKSTYRFGDSNLIVVLRSKKEINGMFNQSNIH